MQAYNFVDIDADTLNNTIYYRLNQIDYDGTASFSHIVSVNANKTQNSIINVYPNPFNDEINIEIEPKTTSKYSISILDYNGK